MAIMQGADNTFWFWVALAISLGAVLAAWYFTVVGRDRAPRRQRRGEETVERFGTIEEDRAPTPKFLLWTYALVVVWVLAYVIWTGIEGIGF